MVDSVFQLIDLNGNDEINFYEFCTATMDERKILKRSNLKAAFALLDSSKNGQIEFDELSRHLERVDSNEKRSFGGG